MPRKAVYLTPLYFDERSCLGGGERYPLNLARGVVAGSGGECTVELLSFGREPARMELGPGVSLRVLEMAGRPANPLDVLSWELPDAIAGADLVHIHQAYTRCTEVGLVVARQLGKPICVTDHGGFTSPMGEQLESLELADRIVAYSDFGASHYRCRTPIAVIKGGVDAEVFRPIEPRPPRDRVVFVGRLLPHKGIDRLIAAMPPDLQLSVCGRPYHEDYYRRLQELAVGKRVEFVTDADDEVIRRLYARAWACVLPSVYQDCYDHIYLVPELMGFTLLEAMACGTPAIASRVGAMPEFVDDGRTGFVFDTAEELTGQIRRLAGDPGLVERMGAEARQTVVREYDLRVAGARLWELYRGLMGRTVEAAA